MSLPPSSPVSTAPPSRSRIITFLLYTHTACYCQIEEVLQFVTGNVRNLLGVDSVVCFPVSSRLALGAKRALAERRFSPIYTASSSGNSSRGGGSGSASEDLDPLAAAAAAHVTLALDPSWQVWRPKRLSHFVW